jgi:HNH endonuclease/AP2 domain
MKRILLSQGRHAIVDDKDYSYLVQWKWSFGRSTNPDLGYAMRSDYSSGKSKTVLMHRIVLERTLGRDLTREAIHRNGNRLDNRRANLREGTPSQRMHHGRRKKPNCTSRYIGVSFHRPRKKWMAGISVRSRQINLGYFTDEARAAAAYNEAAVKYYGEFANQNKFDLTVKTGAMPGLAGRYRRYSK